MDIKGNSLMQAAVMESLRTGRKIQWVAPDMFAMSSEPTGHAPIDVVRMLNVSHKLAKWRPDHLTLELAVEIGIDEGIPFCFECADWHGESEQHSQTDEN